MCRLLLNRATTEVTRASSESDLRHGEILLLPLHVCVRASFERDQASESGCLASFIILTIALADIRLAVLLRVCGNGNFSRCGPHSILKRCYSKLSFDMHHRASSSIIDDLEALAAHAPRMDDTSKMKTAMAGATDLTETAALDMTAEDESYRRYHLAEREMLEVLDDEDIDDATRKRRMMRVFDRFRYEYTQLSTLLREHVRAQRRIMDKVRRCVGSAGCTIQQRLRHTHTLA